MKPATLDETETALRDWSPQWRSALEQFHDTLRETVTLGAYGGALIDAAHRQHREDFWAYLRTLDPDVREAHITIALRAYHYRERHPDPADVSQLNFLLSDGDSAPTDGTAPQSRATSDIAEGIKIGSKFGAWLNRQLRTPPSKWDPALRRSIRELLRPWAELFQTLE